MLCFHVGCFREDAGILFIDIACVSSPVTFYHEDYRFNLVPADLGTETPCVRA